MWLLIACTDKAPTTGDTPLRVEEVQVDLTPTQTGAVEVRWQTPTPSRGWVEYGNTKELGRKSPMELEARTDHALLLVGIPYGEAWQLRAAWESDEEVSVSKKLSYQAPGRTMNGRFSLEEGKGDQEGFFLVPVTNGALISDRKGRVVWESEDMFPDFSHSQVRVVDGVVYRLVFDRADSGLDRLIGVDLAGNPVTQLSLPGAHHDFVFRGEDLYYLDRDTRPGPTGVPWVGSTLIRRSPDGTETPIWSTWDIALPRGPEDRGFYEAGLDMAHINGLSWNEDQQIFLISSKIQNCVWAIDGEGTALWSIGDIPGALELTEGSWVGTPHGPLLVGDLVYLFDNEPIQQHASRAVAYELDRSAGTFREVWSYSDGETRNLVTGNSAPTSSGNTFVFYGRTGGITEVEPDGTVAWTLSTPPSGYMHAVENLGGALPE